MQTDEDADRVLTNEKPVFLKSKNCRTKWWTQDYRSQRSLCRIIESYSFRALIILLVIVDTSLVIAEIILDSFKIHYECEKYENHSSKFENNEIIHNIELAMEIAHYASIAVLIFFILELFVRLYAFGREFWNFRRKKMEYFDAFIVIMSLIIDLYLLHERKEVFEDQLLLIFSFRLWRFVRIVSSVAEGIRHGERKHKQNLNKQYLIAVRRLLDLLKYKTHYFQNNQQSLESIDEHLQQIDDECETLWNSLNYNHELTSSLIVAQFNQDLNNLKYDYINRTISALVLKPHEN